MKQIIDWCNCNQGFLSALLSILTILISGFTIFLSWKIGKMPFRNAISVTVSTGGKDDGGYYRLHIVIVNIGNIPMYIGSVEVTDREKHHLGSMNTYYENKDFIILNPNEIIDDIVIVKNRNELFDKYELDFNGKIKIIVKELNGKRHTFSKGWAAG
jgi:hypothetical protein